MIKKKLLAASIAATLFSGMIASNMTAVFAADNPPASTEAPAKEQVANDTTKQVKVESAKAKKDFVKVSEDAQLSMRDLHSARLAIFNGQPERARTYVDAAETRIGAAVEDAEKYAIDTKEPQVKGRYVPFDANLTVMDTYEPTEAKAQHIAKANAHIQKGENKKAIEELKLGEINVAISTSLLPVKFAKEQIEQAAQLIGKGKYYEANLALKAVDDAVIVQTVTTDALPKTVAKTTTKTEVKPKD
jgi:hypothetical protein